MNRTDKFYSHIPFERERIGMLPPSLVDGAIRATTWTYKHGDVSVMERGQRIKPDKANRRPVQRMQWRNSRWQQGFKGEEDEDLPDFESRISSMTIADVSPKLAVKRVLVLYENSQYREAANFINRLNHSTFKAIITELPIDLFVESMPHSLPILEALYAKVFLSDGLNFSIKYLRPESVVTNMVRFFAKQEEMSPEIRWETGAPFVCSCKKLLKVIILSDPKIKKTVSAHKRSLDKALEGMGQHGMVGTSDESLMNLHDALKVEFQKVVSSYNLALQKLEELSLANKTAVTRSISHGPAPIQSSHQRLLALKQEEIQDRLIKNKSLLNVIEPNLSNNSLDILLGILQRRIECDKDVMFQFTQLKKEIKDINPNGLVAPILMRYSQGCGKVLELMKEVSDDGDDSSDISGYHSGSDSAIMMSGNSPFVSKRARCNFLYRSVRLNSKVGTVRGNVPFFQGPSSGSGSDHGENTNLCDNTTRTRQAKHKKGMEKFSSTGSHGSDVSTIEGQMGMQVLESQVQALNKDIETLRNELQYSRQTIAMMQEREKKLKDRLGEQAEKMLERGTGLGVRFENVAGADNKRPTFLVRQFGDLYTQARVDTLDSLDSIPELIDAEELKAKLLFSVIVLAFRSTQSTSRQLKDTMRRILQVPPASDVAGNRDHKDLLGAVKELESSVQLFLQKNSRKHDLSRNVEEVCSQIWSTLYDYPCLKTCEGLIQYIKDCVRLCWSLVNQNPPLVLEYETRGFRKDMHIRFHTSDNESNSIRTYLWPALFEGSNGTCVHKGVVLT